MSAVTTSRPGAATLQSLGRALKHRNYRLFFMGQGVSLIGTWLTKSATAWLVYRLTHSAWLLGVVTFAGQIPTFFLSPFAGVWIDRWNRHRLLVITQVLAMIESGLLAATTLMHTVTVSQLIALNVFQGLINAFDVPCRQSFVVDMVDKREDLPNAIALNSSMVTLARSLGPSIGGALILLVGEGICFTLDAASYVAVIASLLMMRVSIKPRPVKEQRVIPALVEGFRYVAGFKPMAWLLILLAIVSLMGVPYSVLMPVMATEVLKGGPNTFGFLMGAAGVGAMVGALYLASRTSVLGLGRIVSLAALAFGISLVGFSFSRWFPLSMVLMVTTGMGMMVQMAASNTILQTLVDDDKRGRVMSFYAMAFFGTAPLGSLMAGAMAGLVGAPWTICIGGVVTLLAAIFFSTKLPGLRVLARPVYVERGILPEVAVAVETEANARPSVQPELVEGPPSRAVVAQDS